MDRDKRYLSNWRAISLINVEIGSKAIAKRFEKILPYVIHHNHCAYVKGRTTDVMDFTERCHIDGRLICIDFQKAFDTVNREFLFHTLSTFGFGSLFIQWILTSYNNIQYNTILYLTTQHPGVIRNSFKHVRETKSIENKRNSLKLPL